jgi:hypothetical protein
MSTTTRTFKRITQAYTDPSRPGALGGIHTFVRNNPEFSRKDVERWAQTSDTYTLHKPRRIHFSRNRIYVHARDEQWQADLTEMPMRFVRENDGYRYLLTVVDILSKSAWAVPLRIKTGASVAQAFSHIFQQSGRQPQKLQTDDGKEFLNVHVRQLLRSRKIVHFTYNNQEIKAACVERFNRTLKTRMERYLTHNNTHGWIDSLDKIMRSYNNTVHTSIRMTPNDAKSSRRKSVEALSNLYKPRIAQLRKLMRDDHEPREDWKRLRVGDTVRISMYRHNFRHKGYEQGWTDEYFTIAKIEPRSPTVYRLADLQGKPITGTFYRHELQRVVKDAGAVHRIERVLRRRYNKTRRRWEALVRWQGWGPEHDSWVAARSVRDL